MCTSDGPHMCFKALWYEQGTTQGINVAGASLVSIFPHYKRSFTLTYHHFVNITTSSHFTLN